MHPEACAVQESPSCSCSLCVWGHPVAPRLRSSCIHTMWLGIYNQASALQRQPHARVSKCPGARQPWLTFFSDCAAPPAAEPAAVPLVGAPAAGPGCPQQQPCWGPHHPPAEPCSSGTHHTAPGSSATRSACRCPVHYPSAAPHRQLCQPALTQAGQAGSSMLPHAASHQAQLQQCRQLRSGSPPWLHNPESLLPRCSSRSLPSTHKCSSSRR